MDVVALSHNDLRTYYKEYAREAVGRELVLQPQPENVKDPYAVKVREGNVHVGYVSVCRAATAPSMPPNSTTPRARST